MSQASTAAGTANLAAANQRRKEIAAPKRALLKEERTRRALLKKLKKLLKQYKRHLLAQERLRLASQHGTSINDYYRCKKANTTACTPCRKVSAAYRRSQVAKDPEKFKQQDKEYYLRYPHKKLHNNRARARKRGIPSQYYTRQQIFDRDGHNCYICDNPIDMNVTHIQGQPGWELYPHVDHVVPLALGGHDVLANVKIAHAICNMRKGTSLLV